MNEENKCYLSILLIKEKKYLYECIDYEMKCLSDPDKHMMTDKDIIDSKDWIQCYEHHIDQLYEIAKDLGVKIL